MKTIFILMDSLNRHMLRQYQPETWVQTPNIDRLAAKSVVCENHWAGSLPCMPARRDLFTGRYNFLERNWGPIEPFDVTLPELLRKQGIFTHMITDHYHYFEIGGENYVQQFQTWEFHRGQEYDPWVSRVDLPAMPEEYYGKLHPQYQWNRTQFLTDADYPSPRTFASACQWLRDNEGADDFFLMVEAFDPHEPFDAPQEFLDLYGDDYDGPHYDWSGYKKVEEPHEATEHLRKRYAATLTMNDKWLGKLLDVLDEQDLWKDTLVILTTDHGHLLGEHNFVGKNITHVYNELAHIPLIVHLPGSDRAGERVRALTQTIDFMPTLLEYYGITTSHPMHGQSLKAVWEGTETKVHDTVLFGYHGKTVNITDGNYTYFRAPVPNNQPCYIYCVIPTTFKRYMGRNGDGVEYGKFLDRTEMPVMRIPANVGGLNWIRDSILYDIRSDYLQQRPLQDKQLEQVWIEKLIEAMKQADAPEEQYERLGLRKDGKE